jgi:aryl-alcohol dehydrogenase-like predicted oxidoreductase
VPIEVTLEALDRMIEQGKVRAIGCSNQDAHGLMKSLWMADRDGLARYETIQNNYSILSRRFEDALKKACRREQVSLLPYSPIAGGVLSGKYQNDTWPEGARFSLYRKDPARGAAMAGRFINERSQASIDRFTAIADDCGHSLTTFATAWTLSRDFVASTLIGATTLEQLDDTLAAAGVTLPDDALAACDAVSREIPYPLG